MNAIVYTSNAGHSARYAAMLGEMTGLPVFSLKDAIRHLDKGVPVIYVGWLCASMVMGYKKAARRFRVEAVAAVGLCDTGTGLEGIRKANGLAFDFPVFTLQGGMDKSRLKGVFKSMINVLIKVMNKKKNPTEDDQRMIWLLENDRDYVSEENTADFMAWFHRQK